MLPSAMREPTAVSFQLASSPRHIKSSHRCHARCNFHSGHCSPPDVSFASSLPLSVAYEVVAAVGAHASSTSAHPTGYFWPRREWLPSELDKACQGLLSCSSFSRHIVQ